MNPRLGLTTTADRIPSQAETVESAGLCPVALPCIQAEPADQSALESSRRLASECDWLVLTSSRTVTTLWPHGGIPDVTIAAVGATTAAAVESAGGRARVVGQAGADQLFDTLAAFVADEFVYFPHAASADLSSLRSTLSQAGRLETDVVYHVRPVPPGRHRVDAVVFASPSAVTGWFQAREADGLVVGAIGATTAKALEERGVVDPIVPERPSFERLVAMLASHLGERSPV